MNSRTVLRVSGPEHVDFLQDLVSNDLGGVASGAIYAALLTPQGKYLFDFLVVSDGDSLLLDSAADRAPQLAQRLTMYRLRRKVEIEPSDVQIAQVFGTKPEGEGVVADPRHPDLGWRMYGHGLAERISGMEPATDDDWTRLRIDHAVPETGIELLADESYILEAGFEALHGVDFRKGCYVGQEVTARMKHKTELKKGLVQVAVEGEAPPAGTEILADGKAAGTLYSTADGKGLAHLRFDRATGEMRAGAALVTRL
ncbi:YgfZ/GcvT domain-containing protein [Algicella marina]|uniref:Folate-binding protein n=1 Tax=Algicella marina TaxID=2683284 RepID=A0A6P1T5P9_9RHOB|nr:folate-binding protein YgfZ [Algicella marina]QHQ37377.1 folate-binding protein [Algicella marina]